MSPLRKTWTQEAIHAAYYGRGTRARSTYCCVQRKQGAIGYPTLFSSLLFSHPLPPASLVCLVDLGLEDLDVALDLLDVLVDCGHLQLVLVVVRLSLRLNKQTNNKHARSRAASTKREKGEGRGGETSDNTLKGTAVKRGTREAR